MFYLKKLITLDVTDLFLEKNENGHGNRTENKIASAASRVLTLAI